MRRPDLRQLSRKISGELDRFCEEWIGWSLPPVAQVVADAQWQPCARTSYCDRCGQTVGAGEMTDSGCAACRKTPFSSDGIVRLGDYSGDLRQWILQIKYGRWTEMAAFLGRELGRAVKMAGTVELSKALVTPMPMPWLRRVYRGIDHAHAIAHATARELGVPVARLLTKANGPTQLGVPRTARQINARRGMRIRRRFGGWPLSGLHVIVVDDVRTTGSSLTAATRLIRPLGAERVVAAVVAVAESGRRGTKSGVESSEELLVGTGEEKISPV